MANVTVKQITRTFSGGYSITFPKCFDNIRDFKVKNYSNFYLSDNIPFSSAFEVNNVKLKSSDIVTSLQYGGSYLQYTNASQASYKYSNRYLERDNYRDLTFTDTLSTNTYFNVQIGDDNTCRIYVTLGYKTYYMVVDVNGKFSLVLDNLIPDNSTAINPHDFTYLFSETDNNLVLFKPLSSGVFVVSKTGNALKLISNTLGFINTPFKMSRSIYQYTHVSQDTSYITYTNDNYVDKTNSTFNLPNNLLLHRTAESNVLNTIVLKNQLVQDDVFSCSNTLISGGTGTILVDKLRDYTSIAEDISEETTNNLDLNYIFYNKSYKIVPGINVITTTSLGININLLNINDTKFIDSGAFAHYTPEFADKVYDISDTKIYNGQHLLCTWLSGAPQSSNSVWVDRYYYPDLIEKQAALAGSPYNTITYSDQIEQLIANNQTLSNSVAVQHYFDKISDLVFRNYRTYIYERLNTTQFKSLTSTINVCNSYSSTKPINYFERINDSSKFSLGFYFIGDTESWIVQSDRNSIDSGLKIEKSGQSIVFTYKMFDLSASTTTEVSQITTQKAFKLNFIFVSIDAILGKGYFFINNTIVLEFALPAYQFIHKQLLYGNFTIYHAGISTDLLLSHDNIISPFITDTYIDKSIAFIKPMLDGKIEIDPIYITLPCGMKNSIDSIEYLQSASKSSTFKSNNVNIIVKNLNVSENTLLNNLSSSIYSDIQPYLPVNTSINSINFENYR